MKIGIIGTGLMGTSFAIHVKECMPEVRIFGFDSSEKERENALKTGVFESFFESLDDFKSISVIFVCVPLKYAENICEKLINDFPDSIITDISSVKEKICSRFENKENFVGGHPMTGSERKGASSAEGSFFDNSLYILCPSEIQAKNAKIIKSFLEELNINVYQMSYKEHDVAIAYCSHLPYFAAVSLVNSMDNPVFNHISNVAGSGFRDTTRVAGSPSDMWSEISKENSENIIKALKDYKKEIESTIYSIESKNTTEISDKARDLRYNIIDKRLKNTGDYVLELNVPDKPGILAEIFTTLDNVNIKNIEIENIREHSTGALRIFFRNYKDYLEAKERLVTIKSSND